VVAVLLGGSTLATAQTVETEELDHRGPAASIALGSGYAADDLGGGLASVVHIEVGWFFTARFGALLGLSGITRPGDDAWINHTFTHVAAEYWLDADWYVRAAFGGMLAAESRRPEGGSSDATEIVLLARGVGGMVALGHPVWAWRRLALNLHVAAGAGRFPDDAPVSGAYHVTTCLELAIQ
jgi:hypothetical protein